MNIDELRNDLRQNMDLDEYTDEFGGPPQDYDTFINQQFENQDVYLNRQDDLEIFRLIF